MARASCADHVAVSYIIPLSSPWCGFVRVVSHAYERAARGSMCNGVVPPGILAITFEVGVTLPGNAAEAEVPWTRWAREHRRCGGGGKARGAEENVRQVLQRTCARAYRREPAGPARVERQQHHASPPPQHALCIPFSDARQPSKVLGSRAFAKDGFLWRARPGARKSHRFLRGKGGFVRARVKKLSLIHI